MALSPWQVLSRLSCDEIASLLAGFDFAVESNSTFVNAFADEPAIRKYHEWRLAIVRAVERNELTPCSDWKISPGIDLKPNSYAAVAPDPRLIALHMEATFEREEVYRWLKSQGVSENDLPEELRVIAVVEEAKEYEPEEASSSVLATIAALLDLLINPEVDEKGSPMCIRYDQSRIIKVIGEKNRGVLGLSESTLQKLFPQGQESIGGEA